MNRILIEQKGEMLTLSERTGHAEVVKARKQSISSTEPSLL